MQHRYAITLLFLLSSSIVPVAASGQQPDAKPADSQAQPTSPPEVQSPTTKVQPDRTPQQSDQARQQDRRSAEDTKINPNWTIRDHNEGRTDMDRARPMGQDRDDRTTVGRNWHRDYDTMERGPNYRDDDRYYEPRARRRVKICTEYENGDEFCHYRD
jgi:hypothetical protein